MNMSKLYPKCQYFVGAPLLSSTALILLGMEFTRAAQVVDGILFHSSINNDITELLDVRHRCFSTFRLRMSPHVLNRVQVWRHTWPLHHLHLQQQGSCNLGGVFGVVVYDWKTVSEGRASSSASECHSTMLESMFPSMNRSSPVPTVVMHPQTMMLPPPCLTVGKATIVLYSSPGRCHTGWTPSESNKFTLDSCEPASEEASFWDDGHANRLVAVCGV